MVLAVTGSAGLVEGYTYSTFGELRIWDQNGKPRNRGSVFGNIFEFQGQVYDDLTGTYSMRAREYQPAWGTFLSPDPIGTGGGPSLYTRSREAGLSQREIHSDWSRGRSNAEWARRYCQRCESATHDHAAISPVDVALSSPAASSLAA